MKRKRSAVTFFKQKSYMLAMVLVLAAVFGMTGVYFSEQHQAKKEQQEEARLAQQQEDQEKLAQQKQQALEKQKEDTQEVDAVILPKNDDFLDSPEVISSKDNINTENISSKEQEPQQEAEPEVSEPETQETAAAPEPELHFDAADMGWPLAGNVIMNYSMDQTVYFATLDQYKYNPALIIQGNVNDKVMAVAEGKVEQIATNEETGCTVTVNLGDGYQAVYGQLKEVPLAEGDWIAAGDIVGYVSEPTKYYAVEGANLYFQLLKDGESVDPMEFLQ